MAAQRGLIASGQCRKTATSCILLEQHVCVTHEAAIPLQESCVRRSEIRSVLHQAGERYLALTAAVPAPALRDGDCTACGSGMEAYRYLVKYFMRALPGAFKDFPYSKRRAFSLG
jgi:hypothetical protein